MSFTLSAEDEKATQLRNRRREYKSLDEFARQEGVEAVLAFLASNPTVVGDKYRHSQMKVLPYSVQGWNK